MVVDNFNVFRTFVRPAEADAELVVDPNTVLASSISAKRFKAVSGRTSQIGQNRGGVQHIELSQRLRG